MSGKKYYWLRFARRAAQTLSLGLLVAAIWHVAGTPGDRAGSSPLLNPEYYFYADALVMYAAAIAERVILPGLAVAAAVLIVTAVFGRAFCGWFCPLGALQDLAAALKRGVFHLFGRRRAIEHENEPSRARFVKSWILLVIGLAALAGVQVAWVLDPFAIMVRGMTFTVRPAVNAGIDRVFRFALETLDFPASLEIAYNFIREAVIGVEKPLYPHSGAVAILFALILLAVVVKRRFWCRYLCPLGALLGIAARYVPYRRKAGSCLKSCRMCRHTCRMNAVRGDGTCDAQECILCYDCAVDCPYGHSRFAWDGPEKKKQQPGAEEKGGLISRKEFIARGAGTVTAAGLLLAGNPGNAANGENAPIRPPGALPERDFIQRCIRCGACMKACPTNALQPAGLAWGLAGLWTPRLDPAIGYCEYGCNLCGRVCPTDAIAALPLARKQEVRIGIARIDEKTCLPWAKGEPCIVCEEHCPISTKAILLREKRTPSGTVLQLPYIDEKLCIGCLICVNKCPLTPKKGVRCVPPGPSLP